MSNRSFLCGTLPAVIATLGLIATPPASAAWPDDKPITLVVPFAPGGNTDVLARIVAERLRAPLGVMVVENRPGAGSMIGSTVVARAAPDGYTFLVGSISNALNPSLYKNPTYNFVQDLVPVAQLVKVPNYLAAGPKEPFESVSDVINYAKQHPGRLSCATSGVGTSPYLSCELLKTLAGVDIVNAPYKGGAPAMQDTIGGQTNLVFVNEALPNINAGLLKGLAVTTPTRSPLAPTLPALAETLPGFDVTAWYGIFAPRGTPAVIVERVSREIAAILAPDDMRKRLAMLGAVPVGSSPAEFKRYVEREVARWGELIRAMNISLD